MKYIYVLSDMKKIIFAVVMLLALPYVVSAQDVNPMMDENNPDSIKVTYVPNAFKDNWELSIAGGVSVLFNGLGHVEETTSAPTTATGHKMFDAVGGVGEIAATKWFNPYVAARIGWMTGYLPYVHTNSEKSLHNWHNYAHIDMLWDWTTQFGGYKPDRKYDAVPYVHVGVSGNPDWNVMMAGGAGFLNRFHINKHWLINLDLRATATTSRKFGLSSGVAIDVNALLGVTYRFNETDWKKKIYNPYGPEVSRLQGENEDLLRQLEEMRKNANKELVVQLGEQGDKEIQEGIIRLKNKRNHEIIEMPYTPPTTKVMVRQDDEYEMLVQSPGHVFFDTIVSVREDVDTQLCNVELKPLKKGQAENADDQMKGSAVGEAFVGLPDTLEMTVFYAINEDKLSAFEQAHLRTYLRLIKMNDPENQHHFIVTGTADKGTGSLEYNKQLSAARAEAIKQALIDNGIKEEQIEVRTEIIPTGDAKMARASHVTMYPLAAEK